MEPRFTLEDETPAEPRRRLAVYALAAAITLALVALALVLGSWAFQTRQLLSHHGRLERLQQQEPQLDLVVRAFADEGTVLLAGGDTAERGLELAARFGGAQRAQVEEKARRSSRLRVFATADMLYFVFFDAGGVMRDFVVVKR